MWKCLLCTSTFTVKNLLRHYAKQATYYGTPPWFTTILNGQNRFCGALNTPLFRERRNSDSAHLESLWLGQTSWWFVRHLYTVQCSVHTHYHYGNVSDLSCLRILLADTNLNSTSSSEYGCGWAVGPRGTLNMEIKEISNSNYFTLMDCYDSRYIA